MISPEILRRYPFFAGLDYDQIVGIAQVATEENVENGAYFFHDGEQVDKFYLLVDGAVSIVIEVPDRETGSSVAGQLTGNLKMKDIVVSTVGKGSVFGWPGLIPPHEAHMGAKAVTDARVFVFDCNALLEKFEADPRFAYMLTLKAAQVMRERLRDMAIESLAFSA
ncbi:MAG: Crp/Fnr family transcriptional regulator [Anaerolineales bacterium]|nr:Crp/Fnr family transcriptional regulator [Anaerolineales bacterium]